MLIIINNMRKILRARVRVQSFENLNGREVITLQSKFDFCAVSDVLSAFPLSLRREIERIAASRRGGVEVISEIRITSRGQSSVRFFGKELFLGRVHFSKVKVRLYSS